MEEIWQNICPRWYWEKTIDITLKVTNNQKVGVELSDGEIR